MKGTIALGVLAAIALTGCQSQLTGNEGNLVFSYTADDNIGDFNKPIAVGAKLEIRVTESGTRRSVSLNEVTTEDADVLGVESFSGDRFILQGAGDGATTVLVDATDPAGEVVTDSVNMLSATPTELELWHTCKDRATGTAHYTMGSEEVILPYDMKDDRGRDVIGYGLMPWTQEPAETLAADMTSRDQASIHVNLPDAPATVVLSSIFDDSTLTLEVVDPATIDGTELNAASAIQRVIADETHLFHFYPTVGEDRICQSKVEMTIEEKSAEICEVNAIDDNEDSRFINESNWVSVKGLAQGSCVFDVIYPAGNGGAGAREEVTIEIAAFAE